MLQDTWSHVEFKFTQHKGTDVYLVKMAEEDFEALEDNQVLVQVSTCSCACVKASAQLTLLYDLFACAFKTLAYKLSTLGTEE